MTDGIKIATNYRPKNNNKKTNKHRNSVERIKQKIQKQMASLPELTPGLQRTRRAQLRTHAPESARHTTALQSLPAHCRGRLRVEGRHTNFAKVKIRKKIYNNKYKNI